ncbi:hypothetical protein DFH27DRAFT_652150 [Peziza echinospora]|nr:hypothetical protein DFH27DRAFT_652150 [Peziza echinospora]
MLPQRDTDELRNAVQRQATAIQRQDDTLQGIQTTLRLRNILLEQIIDLIQETKSEVEGLRTEVRELRAEVRELRADVRQNENSLNRLERENNLLPMRLHNAGVSDEAPLQYPDWVQLEPPLPMNRRDLLQLTSHNYAATARILGLPALHESTTVDYLRRQIAQYLGVIYVTIAP